MASIKRAQLNELTPADQAKALGLVYGGFGGWIDPETRVKKAETIDGKLVRTDGDGDGDNVPDLGKINIFVLDHDVIEAASNKPSKYVETYNSIIKKLVKLGGGEMVILIQRNTEREIAEYLRKLGISAGLKLTPIDAKDPNKVRDYVEEKIKAGYSVIKYFDCDPINVNAVESLRAPYNKLDLTIDTHPLTKMDRTPS